MPSSSLEETLDPSSLTVVTSVGTLLTVDAVVDAVMSLEGQRVADMPRPVVHYFTSLYPMDDYLTKEDLRYTMDLVESLMEPSMNGVAFLGLDSPEGYQTTFFATPTNAAEADVLMSIMAWAFSLEDVLTAAEVVTLRVAGGASASSRPVPIPKLASAPAPATSSASGAPSADEIADGLVYAGTFGGVPTVTYGAPTVDDDDDDYDDGSSFGAVPSVPARPVGRSAIPSAPGFPGASFAGMPSAPGVSRSADAATKDLLSAISPALAAAVEELLDAQRRLLVPEKVSIEPVPDVDPTMPQLTCPQCFVDSSESAFRVEVDQRVSFNLMGAMREGDSSEVVVKETPTLVSRPSSVLAKMICSACNFESEVRATLY